MSPDITPATARSPVAEADCMCRSMLRDRSNTRSIGASMRVMSSMTGIASLPRRRISGPPRLGAQSDARLRQLLELDVPVFHLVAVRLQADGPARGQGQRIHQHLAVAFAMRDVVLHRHDDFIPVLRLVFLQLLVRPRHEVIAALE